MTLTGRVGFMTWRVFVMQADNHQENLVVSEIKKLEVDGLVNFISVNEVRYITEYNQVVRHHCHLTHTD